MTRTTPTTSPTPTTSSAPASAATPDAPAPWSDLVSAALLGTGRRTPPVAGRR